MQYRGCGLSCYSGFGKALNLRVVAKENLNKCI